MLVQPLLRLRKPLTALMLTLLVPLVLNNPAPDSVLVPVTLNGPVTVTGPVPPSVPLESVMLDAFRSPLLFSVPPETARTAPLPIEDVPARSRVPPETVKLSPLTTPAAACAPVETVTIGLAGPRSTRTSCPDVGTPRLHLPASLQIPLLSVSHTLTGVTADPTCKTASLAVY